MGSVLITGGAGYIGSHVAHETVAAGRDVIIVDNLVTGARSAVPSKAHFIEADLADGEVMDRLFDEHPIDAIMHFAGSVVVPESVSDPIKYYSNNTANSLSLIALALRKMVKAFIFSSTAAVYAPNKEIMVSEAAPIGPITPYGMSKRMTEVMLQDVTQAHGLPFIALRYFNVAGADREGRTGQSTPSATHLIKVACQAALGVRAPLEIYGQDYDTPDGTCIRDYIHVTDLAQAHLLALSHLEAGADGEIMNVGYGRGVSVLEVLEAVGRAAGKPVPTRKAGRRDGDAPALIADSAKLRSTLNWTPVFDDLDVIVRSTLDWERRLLPT